MSLMENILGSTPERVRAKIDDNIAQIAAAEADIRAHEARRLEDLTANDRKIGEAWSVRRTYLRDHLKAARERGEALLDELSRVEKDAVRASLVERAAALDKSAQVVANDIVRVLIPAFEASADVMERWARAQHERLELISAIQQAGVKVDLPAEVGERIGADPRGCSYLPDLAKLPNPLSCNGAKAMPNGRVTRAYWPRNW